MTIVLPFPSFVRRAVAVVLLLIVAAPDSEAQLFRKKRKNQAAETDLQPGQFEWHPEKAPAGPLLVVVSIDDQMAYVYRNAVQIGRSTVSTGRPGKETPTGVFTILQKNKDHESNIYKGAKMPNMQRLTWTGIALHAGELPGYPASAGCVRLPLEFSSLLFNTTGMGTTVVITQRGAAPSQSEKPASVLFATQVEDASAPIPDRPPFWDPRKSPEGPVSILLSAADQTIYAFRNGVLIGQAPVGIAQTGQPLPGGIFLMLEGTLPGTNQIVPGRPIRPWSALTLEAGAAGDPLTALQSRLRIHSGFARNLYEVMGPGTLLMVTNEASSAETRSESGFVVMNPDGPPLKSN